MRSRFPCCGDETDACDPPTPQQFQDINCRSAERPGELRLLLALLIDAIRCFFGNSSGSARRRLNEQQEAVMWVVGRWESALSFDDVCSVLGIDPNWLRAELFRRLPEVRDKTQVQLRRQYVAGSSS